MSAKPFHDLKEENTQVCINLSVPTNTKEKIEIIGNLQEKKNKVAKLKNCKVYEDKAVQVGNVFKYPVVNSPSQNLEKILDRVNNDKYFLFKKALSRRI